MTEPVTVDATTIEAEITALQATVPQYPVITTPAQADEVSSALSRISDFKKKISEFFCPNIEKAHSLHKALLAQKKQAEAGPNAAESKCRELLGDWQARQLAAQKAEQDRLDREAREQAAALARDEAARLRAEGDKAAGLAAEREAAKIESGKIAVVSTVIAAPIKVAGITASVTFSATLVDMNALMKAIMTGRAPSNFISFNQSEADRFARNTKGGMPINGVQFTQNNGIRRTR